MSGDSKQPNEDDSGLLLTQKCAFQQWFADIDVLAKKLHCM